MEISKRDFLKYVDDSPEVLSLAGVSRYQVERALAASSSPAVVWLQGTMCSGCSASLLSALNPAIDDRPLDAIDPKYRISFITGGRDLAIGTARRTHISGGHILVVEGAIPARGLVKYSREWEIDGRASTMAEAFVSLAAKARYVLAVGSCSLRGGIPVYNATAGTMRVDEFVNRRVIHLNGCPSHPDFVMSTLLMALTGKLSPSHRSIHPEPTYSIRRIERATSHLEP